MRPETPLARVEREVEELKRSPDIVIPSTGPDGVSRLGPWQNLGEHMKDLLLSYLDWTGVSPDDRSRIVGREVNYDVLHADIFAPYRRKDERIRE